MTNKLTAKERKNLKTLEEVIEAGLGTFSRVGRALLQIRDCRLYRGSFESFDAYCQERWEFSRQRAHQLITAASTAEELSTIVDTPPAREAHVRPLLSLPPEYRGDVWQAAVASAPTGPDGRPRVTARCVEAAVALAVERLNQGRVQDSGFRVQGGETSDQVIDVESSPVEVAIPPPDVDADLVRCRCCGRDVEPDEDGDCPACHEPEIVGGAGPSEDNVAGGAESEPRAPDDPALEAWRKIEQLARLWAAEYGGLVVAAARLENLAARLRSEA
jgi:hypothetical protein